MPEAAWSELETLFSQALELEPAERPAFLARRASSAQVAAEVADMLGASSPERELGVERFAAQLPSIDGALAIERGTRIGSYRVRSKIGQGGTAEVYRAARSDGEYERHVAIKVLRPHLAGLGIGERLRAERQILARLRHPNIATLFDGGVLEDGRPYLVMELIEGRTLLEECDARRLTIRERLELFLVVCGAVGHAHNNLIAHRDLKPSNILVSSNGDVRLLDFGLAKLLDGTGGSNVTQTLQRMLTPDYASPEQVLGEPITTATDVYSLGLLLYELLTGDHPQRRATGDFGELSRWLREGDTPAPSASLGELARSEDLSAVAERRGIDGARLRRALEGDLDVIVSQCLRRRPEDRTRSVAELADDIQRHLDGRPISARSTSKAYRLRKLLRRHPLAAAFTAAATVSLVLFAASMTWQVGVVQHERDVAREERDRADEVADLLVRLFGSVPYDPETGQDPTLRAFLETSEERLRTSLTDQPDLRASLLNLLAQAHIELGLYESAQELARESLELRTQLLGSAHGDVAQSLDTLGTTQQHRGEYREAERSFRRALALRTELHGPRHLDVAESVNNLLGLLTVAGGDFAERESLALEGLALRRELLGAEHLSVSQSLNNLAAQYYQQGASEQLEKAEVHYRDALEIRRRHLGDLHPDVAIVEINLAEVLSTQGRFPDAERLFRRAVGTLRSALGDDHPQVASALYGLSFVLQSLEDPHGAERVLREALEIYRAKLPPDHPFRADTALVLGRLLLRLERAREAEAPLREAALARAESLGALHLDTLVAQADLARALVAAGQFREGSRLVLDVRGRAETAPLEAEQRAELLAQLPREMAP